MKLSLKRIFIMTLVAALISGGLNVSAADFYSDDTFRYISTSQLSPVSGWDFDKSGGDIVWSGNDGILLYDTSYKSCVSMKRALECKDGEDISVEAVIKSGTYIDNMCLALSKDGEDVVKVYTTPKNLMIRAGGTIRSLISYTPNVNIGIKLVFDADGKTVTPVINGVTYDKLSVTETAVDSVKISTPEKAKARVTVDAFRVYGGYSVNECFIPSSDVVPDYWKVSGDAQMSIAGGSAPDLYAMKIASGSMAETSFTPVNGAARYEVRFLTGDTAYFVWGNDSSDAIALSAEEGKLSVDDEKLSTYDTSVWQRIEVEVTQDGTASVMHNGKYIKKNLKINSQITHFGAIAQGADVYIDDILAYEDNREDISVPEIKKAESDKYIGMMRCDIWHEGRHMGWDYILPYEENHPYLGFYDDGKSAVSDWETKWMAEHGVDFQMHCWFLPRKYTDGDSIKLPNNAYTLEDGYFHSKYSEALDFAIMWENAEAEVSYDTFVNCIIPYWSEYYLSDTRYARTADNKAIIGIYNAEMFLKKIGGGNVSTAKAALDVLREKCKSLGYADAYILCASGGLEALTEEAQMGFDACHSYSWRDISKTADAQKSFLDTAKENAISAGIDTIPTVSVGIDETPWHRPSGNMHTAQVFEEILQYADGIQTNNNMILLDNWNEFGEGHYIMPTTGKGFGYLDAVRNVFAPASSSHNDEVPSEADIKSMGTLFDETRTPWPVGEAQIPYGSKILHEWSGEGLNTSEWRSSRVESFTYSNGILKGDVTVLDPSIYTDSTSLGISLDGVSYIDITLRKSNGADKTLQLFYTTALGDSFSEAKSIKVETRTDNVWEKVRIPVWDLPLFEGDLQRLRIDPMVGTGTFEINSIQLVGSDIPLQWEGTDLSKWSGASGVTLSYQDGVLKGTATQAPGSILINNLNVSLDDVNYVEVRAKRSCKSSSLKMYYVTDSMSDYTEASSIYVNALRTGDAQTYYLPVWKNADFCGKLNKLRLDIAGSAGTFEVEYIRLLKGTGKDVIPWYVEGEKIDNKIPLQYDGDEVYADYKDVAECFGAGISYIAESNLIKIVTEDDVYLFTKQGELYNNRGIVKDGYSTFKALCGTYMMPLRAVADIFGYNVEYENSVTMTPKELYPRVTYDISQDLDSSGQWKYRNLAPDPSCEDITKFWDSGYDSDKDTLSISDSIFYSGSGSVEKKVKKYNRLGVEADMKANEKYHFSAWMRDETSGNSNSMHFAAAYGVNDETGANAGLVEMFLSSDSANFTLNDTWSYISEYVRITSFTSDGVTYPIGENYTLRNSKFYITQNVSDERTIYMDEMNLRLVPDFRVYTTDISHLDGALIGNEEVVFTFSGDIDKWTVMPENILINGQNGKDLVNVSLETDEQTRSTRVKIRFNTPPLKWEEKTISLADIRDVWGREVKGLTSVTVKGGKPYVSAAFSKADENTTAVFSVHNSETARLTAALYTGEQITMVNSKAANQNDNTMTFIITNQAQWDKVNVFIWSDYENMVPLGAINTFTKSEITAAIEGSA